MALPQQRGPETFTRKALYPLRFLPYPNCTYAPKAVVHVLERGLPNYLWPFTTSNSYNVTETTVLNDPEREYRNAAVQIPLLYESLSSELLA